MFDERRISAAKKSFSRIELGEGCILRRKLVLNSVRSQKPLIIPSQITFRISVYPRKFVVIPVEKRGELIRILDDMIKRLLTLINARKTKTRVRLKAMTVLNELINTSYRMIRDEEIEELERETEDLEKEAKRTETEDNAEEEPAKPA
jgi:hypothetical protein